MKLISYKPKEIPGDFRMGLMVNGEVYDLQESYRKAIGVGKGVPLQRSMPTDPASFYRLGKDVLNLAHQAERYLKDTEETPISKDLIELGTPVPAPSKIICIGKNYAAHAEEMKGEVPDYPVLFAKFRNALIGPADDIEKPAATNKLDYEVELGVVIGSEATNVQREDALQYIAGYTIGNDISARDLQKRTPQWLQGKTLDRSTPIGPWVVTADELEDPSNLAVCTFVNGEKRQESSTSHLIFDIPQLINFISSLITLEPGDIILTGTPDGVGVAMDPPHFLKDGDVVRLEIEQIGSMENRVREV
ncbi:fumarylacetoacetate hydrolase family protein [Virgibacillus xinjiangensis]|uniref:Fumarylacetoacetate hydrolase family protein n=1 Tax=Virgibacillus xinjiangensis TaxID=393090 RepID=A0ABV7CXV3_9BACI